MTADPGAEAAVTAAVDAAFRAEWGRVVATLIGVTGDWDLAEECAQDAFARALQTWARDGVPAKPGAWLTTAARNRAIDVLRRRASETAKLEQAARLEPDDLGGAGSPDDPSGIADDRLRLMFTCCHPALALEARVALTLRTLAGLTTTEIRAAPPGSTTPETWSRSRTKTARGGTTRRSTRAAGSSKPPGAAASRPGRTSCRRRSPPATRPPRGPPTPTGGRSPSGTPGSRR